MLTKNGFDRETLKQSIRFRILEEDATEIYRIKEMGDGFREALEREAYMISSPAFIYFKSMEEAKNMDLKRMACLVGALPKFPIVEIMGKLAASPYNLETAVQYSKRAKEKIMIFDAEHDKEPTRRGIQLANGLYSALKEGLLFEALAICMTMSFLPAPPLGTHNTDNMQLKHASIKTPVGATAMENFALPIIKLFVGVKGFGSRSSVPRWREC